MGDETKYKQQLVKHFKDRGHYAARIEDMYGVGKPDLIIVLKNGPVFFPEAKIVRHRKFQARPRQFIELERLNVSALMAVPCIIGYDMADGFTYIHEPRRGPVSVEEAMAQQTNEDLIKLFWRFYHERQSRNS